MEDFLNALKAKYTGYDTFSKNFAAAAPGAADPEALGDAVGSKFSLSGDHGTAVQNVRDTAAQHTAMSSASTPVLPTEEELRKLKIAGAEAETGLHGLMQEHKTIAREAEALYKERLAEAAKIKDTAARTTAVKAAETEYTAFKELHGEHGKVIAGARTEVSGAAKNNIISGSADSVRAVEGAVGTALSEGGKIFKGTKAAEELGVIGEKALKEKGFFGKMVANAKANINVHSIDKTTGEVVKSKFLGKAMKVTGAGLGVIIGGYGLKDLGQVVGVVGPDTDEKGQEIPADGGKLFKGLAELGIGAGALYLTVLKGGKAAGIAK